MDQAWKNEIYKAAKAAKEEEKTIKAIRKAMELCGLEDEVEFRSSLVQAMQLQGYSSEREFLKMWTVQFKKLKSLEPSLEKLSQRLKE